MNPVQEVKIINHDKNTETFFFQHSFKSAMSHAHDYMKRNKGQFKMSVYTLSSKSKPFPKWEFFCNA